MKRDTTSNEVDSSPLSKCSLLMYSQNSYELRMWYWDLLILLRMFVAKSARLLVGPFKSAEIGLSGFVCDVLAKNTSKVELHGETSIYTLLRNQFSFYQTVCSQKCY